MWIFGVIAFSLAVLGSLLDILVSVGPGEQSPGWLFVPAMMACLLAALVFTSSKPRVCAKLGYAALASAGAWCVVLGAALAQRWFHRPYDGTDFLPLGSPVIEIATWAAFGARATWEARLPGTGARPSPSIVRPAT